MVSGCFSQRPQFYPLDVKLKNNAPCFSLPSTPTLTPPVTSYGPIVSLRKGTEWQIISPPTADTPDIIMTEDCQQWPEISWRAGEYSIALQAMSKNDTERYVVRFKLQTNSDGSFKLIKSE
mgnify:CR=1 FL=1